jgi:hypothetical protein
MNPLEETLDVDETVRRLSIEISREIMGKGNWDGMKN